MKTLLLGINGQLADPGSQGLRVRVDSGSGSVRSVHGSGVGEMMWREEGLSRHNDVQ